MHAASWFLGWMIVGQMPGLGPATAAQSSAAVLVAQNDWSSPGGSPYGRRQGAGEQAGTISDDRSTAPGGASIRPPRFDGGDSPSLPGRTDRRRRPPEMIAEAMLLSGSDASGKPLDLLAAVSSAIDRRQQYEIVLAYWRLADAVAEYHYCLEHAKTLDAIGLLGGGGFGGGRRADRAAMLAWQADATAQTQEAHLGLLRAQYDLAAAMRSAPGAPLPLPADRPHVGPYRTEFKSLFADRTPPEPARLADRILPLQWRQVDQQAAAVQAAEDALAATEDDCRAGRAAAATVVGCSQELLRQQRALMGAVCAYNRSIADYKFSVVGPAATPQDLVGGLIITAGTPAVGTQPAAGDGKAVRPASAEEPLRPQTFRGQPQGQPTLAPPRSDSPGPAESDSRAAPSGNRLQPVGSGEPHLAPVPAAGPAREPADIPETRVVPPESGAPARDPFQPSAAAASGSSTAAESGPSWWTARRLQLPDSFSPEAGRRGGQLGAPVADGGSRGRPEATGPRYAALGDASPAGRTKQLTAVLYGDLGVTEGMGKPIALVECLYRANSDRLTTIKAYWLLRERQARFRTLLEAQDMLSSVEPTALEHHNDATGAADMLRLQSARRAAEAAISQAHVALVEAQYALALRIGMLAEAAWPLASTAPHTGSYLLKQELQPRGIIQSWPAQRLIAIMPRLTDTVNGRATAVVVADSARAAATENYRFGRAGIDAVLSGIAGQSQETSALLACVTDFNAAIAEYSLMVLPSGYPADKLAASLVMKP